MHERWVGIVLGTLALFDPSYQGGSSCFRLRSGACGRLIAWQLSLSPAPDPSPKVRKNLDNVLDLVALDLQLRPGVF